MSNKSQMASPRGSWITYKNLKEATIYLAVRHCIEATWHRIEYNQVRE